MSKIARMLESMRRNPRGVRFADLCAVCEHYFGSARQRGTSHRIYRTPWAGDPRVNIQDDRGKGKAYQVRQVLAAIQRLESSDEEN
jgi:hypothetical protein